MIFYALLWLPMISQLGTWILSILMIFSLFFGFCEIISKKSIIFATWKPNNNQIALE